MGWRYRAGLGLIGTVVFIWVASAEITQSIFEKYEQPFALTYLGVSLMLLHLPIAFLKDWLCSLFGGTKEEIQNPNITSSSVVEVVDRHDESHQYSSETNRTTRSCHLTNKDLSEREEGRPLIYNKEVVNKHGDHHHLHYKLNPQLGSREIAKSSLYLAPIWFLSEYLSNSALAYTSVASTTVISSTSGLFTLAFGALLGQDSINAAKVVAVLISMAGVAMTTVGKTWARDEGLTPHETRKHSIEGDILGLFSAISYALFTVLLKRSAGSQDEKVDMQKFLGFIGIFTLVGLWWLLWPLSALGIEPGFSFPDSVSIDEIVVLNGLVGNVLADYFWAVSVIWTTPLVATLGMSLTIPLAMMADMVIHGRHYSAIYIIGCLQARICRFYLSQSFRQVLRGCRVVAAGRYPSRRE
ncbi:unnamed protein product [Linum tenue]|uniref:EamA domain-containing protein n=1 Tax=Linum tenue TaxID=586396 RepID=A0AAV0LX07_9ROSI|nr:unnamed protein product [Linum tenue]